MITPEIIAKLKSPFAIDLHLRNYDGFIYIDETAICDRLDDVDPNWTWEVSEITNRDRKVYVHGSLTILGVRRDGVGMQGIEYVKDKDSKGNVIGETDIETSEPEKGAETDALRRAARKFSLGRYLLQAPKATRDASKRWSDDSGWKQFTAWWQNNFDATGLAKPQAKKTPVKATTPEAATTEMLGSKALVTTFIDTAIKDGKPTLTFKDGANYAVATTRLPLKGIVTEAMYDELANEGRHDLGYMIRVEYEKREDGQWVTKVEAVV